MSSAAQLALQERMQILRKAFANQMPDRLRQLDDALAGGGGGQEEPLAVAERVAHSIRGTGGTFGYAELAAAAGVLESVIKAARQTGHVGAAVGEARGALQRAAAAMSACKAATEVARRFSLVMRPLKRCIWREILSAAASIEA